MSVFVRFFSALCVLLAFGFPLIAAEQSRRIELTQNADYYGFDLRTAKDLTLDECQVICLEDRKCKAFSYNVKKSWCFLKTDSGERSEFRGSIAGKVVLASSEPDIGAPEPLEFTAAFDSEAQTYRNNLVAAAPKNGDASVADSVAAADKAIQSGDARGAYQSFGTAVALSPDDTALWTNLSRAALALTPNADEANYLQQAAVSAAINGYLTSRDTKSRADALVALAKALDVRGEYRPALSAYKASLELVNSKEVEAAYTDLRSRKGFRVVEHSIDTASAAPRICIQFSEPLSEADVDFTPYILLDNAAPKSLTKDTQQLCIDDVEYGKRYSVTVRQGLPSSIAEVIESPVNISVFVRDRDPSVRLDGENFVLPSTARRGIPIVSINATQAELKVFRVNERSLTALLFGSQFLTQLDSYGIQRVRNELGEPVWAGSIALQTEQNKETVTSLSVDEALPSRKPGVYVLTAETKGSKGQEWDPKATQWFVISDIGLTTFAGTDGLTVFARSLETAKPLQGIALKLLAKNNELLGEAVTDATGKASFEPGRTRGSDGLAPAILTADKAGTDFVFLDMARAGFDLSDRGVTGRPAPGALDVYAYTERGVYRPGETIYAAALARDGGANAVDNLPLTFIFKRPDGVEERRIVSNGALAGGHAVDLALPANASQGAWSMRVHTDPSKDPVAEKILLVEDFLPDRTEFDLTSDGFSDDGAADIAVAGRYLYGAPASGLTLEGELIFAPTREWKKFPGYEFGYLESDEDRESPTKLELSELPILDDEGKAVIPISLEEEPDTGALHTAKVVVRMRENGGRAVERSLDIAVPPSENMIGIRQNFSGGQTPENAAASFKVISANAAGERTALERLQWTLVKIDRNYQWYREGSSWRYDAVNFTTKIANGVLDTKPDVEVEISANVQWGHYRLEVESPDENGPVTSSDFNAGWYVESASTETPDGLEVALDKNAYKAGDIAKLKVSPRFAGELLITVGAEKLLATQVASVPGDGAIIDIPVSADWGAGAYVTATLFRAGDVSESRLPMRAIGLKWLGVDPQDRKLGVLLGSLDKIEPRSPLTIPISVTGSGVDGAAYVMVSAVDVGILNLTKHEPADPDGWYFGQRQMGLEIRDIYGRLIDGSQGAFGKLRTGGDGPQAASSGSAPTEKLIAFFSRPVKLDADGKTTVTFDVPQFNGTARINVVAWSASAVGHATKDVIIRDPLVMIASAPKFLAPDDVSQVTLDIANTDGPAGAYALNLIAGRGIDIVSGDLPTSLNFELGGKTSLTVPIVGSYAGQGSLTAKLTHTSGLVVENAVDIPVRAGQLPVTIRRELPLSAGASLTINEELLADSLLGGSAVSVSVLRSSAFDIPAMLMTLDRYPYGCAEQTTSRALPLLYVRDLLKSAGMADDTDVSQRIDDAILRVLSYQSSTGSFGLWGPGSGDLWLDAYVTDFLTRAREQQFDVPEPAMLAALENLQNALSYDVDVKAQGNEIAYALYVLARNRRASATDLRYYSESRLPDFASPMARAHLGAALALYGDHLRAEAAFASALDLAKAGSSQTLARGDYGSALRDDAAMLALAAETRPVSASVDGMIAHVAALRQKSAATSTQEDAWMLMAARAIKNGNSAIALSINGATHSGAFAKRLSGEELLQNDIAIKNRGTEPVIAVVTTVAAPAQSLPAGGNGFAITRTYFKLDGTETSVTEAKQNDRFVVVLNVIEQNNWPSRILVTDLLPAGLEIENPRLVAGAETANFGWLGAIEVAHTEFRTDRFVAALNPSSSGARTFNLAYVVRAVSLGTYTLPAASVEDMYRPGYSARTATSRMSVVESGE